MIFKKIRNSSFEYKYYLFLYSFCLYFFLPLFEVYFINLFKLDEYLLPNLVSAFLGSLSFFYINKILKKYESKNNLIK